MNERITVEGIFVSDVSPSPNYDFIMKKIVNSFFTSSKTKHFTARIPDDYDRKCLNTRFILFNFISGSEITVSLFAEVSDQFVYLGIIDKIFVVK